MSNQSGLAQKQSVLEDIENRNNYNKNDEPDYLF